MKAGAPSPLTCFRRMRTERLSLGICARDSTEAIKRQLTHVRAWAHVGSARSSREAASACAAATVPECKRRGGGAPLRSSRSAHCGHSPLFPLARPRRRSHPWMCSRPNFTARSMIQCVIIFFQSHHQDAENEEWMMCVVMCFRK